MHIYLTTDASEQPDYSSTRIDKKSSKKWEIKNALRYDFEGYTILQDVKKDGLGQVERGIVIEND